ncbi:MAG: HD domain-containing protein [Euryarchaeota archaeon]|nr:HD domain-containing protein [Euryarchaeota archaeon]
MSESKTKKVQDLKVGDSVDTTFLVLEKELKGFVTREGYYLQAKFGDNSGSIWAKCWERAEEAAALFDPGDIIRIKGMVESFKGRLQLIFELPGIVKNTENESVSEYLPRASKNTNRLFAEIEKTAAGMTNDYLKQLVFSFLRDPAFVESFKTAPAAKVHHHNYIGGLLEHTHTVVMLCRTIIRQYPELDRDLLLTGAILHDIGKTKVYEYAFRIDVTAEGGLMDHIVLGYRMVEGKITAITGFPRELKLRLLHLILSHHNFGEWGSPVKPMFAEAQALCYADLLDAQLKEFLQLQKQEEAKGKEGIWSDYNRGIKRFFYIGKTPKE